MSYYSKNDDISFTPITAEEEKELFIKCYAGDTEARNKLITQHLKLAAKISLQLSRGSIPDAEAISAGNYGIIQALESKCFDPNHGARFSSYVRHYIKGQVKKAIRERCSSQPAVVYENFPVGAAATGQVGREILDEDTPRPATNHIGVRYASTGVVRLAGPRRKLLDEESNEHTSEARQLSQTRIEFIEKALATLPAVEAETIRLTYFQDKNFAEIGRSRSNSREGVRKAHDRAMAKLRDILAPMAPELS